MGFRNGAYATVWKVEDMGKWSKVQLSTSRKDQSGNYETDFSGFVMMVGEAHAAAGKLAEKDRIKLDNTEVTTQYDKEKNVTYTNFKCFKFEAANSGGSGSSSAAAKSPEVEPGAALEDELPF